MEHHQLLLLLLSLQSFFFELLLEPADERKKLSADEVKGMIIISFEQSSLSIVGYLVAKIVELAEHHLHL